MPTKNPRVTFTLDQKTLDRIDDFRFSVKSKNQTQAILRLLDAGLSAFEEETKKAPAPQESGTRAKGCGFFLALPTVCGFSILPA